MSLPEVWTRVWFKNNSGMLNADADAYQLIIGALRHNLKWIEIRGLHSELYLIILDCVENVNFITLSELINIWEWTAEITAEQKAHGYNEDEDEDEDKPRWL